MSCPIKPIGGRILIQPQTAEKKTASGIILPDTASQDKPMIGTVVAVGSGKMKDDGTRIPVSIEVGQTVIFTKYGPTEFKHNDEEYLIADESDILGIIES